MALILTSILSLLLTLIEGARIGAIKMQGELAAETSMESALSEFHRELLKQYDLLFIDVSYGTGNYSEEALTEHLTACAEKNLSRGGLSFPEKKTVTGTGEASCCILAWKSICGGQWGTGAVGAGLCLHVGRPGGRDRGGSAWHH